jgi:hypothetical protein
MQAKITKYQVDKLTPGGKDQFLWDVDVKGFGFKATPAGKKVYLLQYRVAARRAAKRFTIGKHGTWAPDTVRKEALRLLRDISSQGIDPAHNKAEQRQAPTLETVTARYLAEYAELHKKARSVVGDRLNLDKHILHRLGSHPVKQLTDVDMDSLHCSGRGLLCLVSNSLVDLASYTFCDDERSETDYPEGDNRVGKTSQCQSGLLNCVVARETGR